MVAGCFLARVDLIGGKKTADAARVLEDPNPDNINPGSIWKFQGVYVNGLWSLDLVSLQWTCLGGNDSSVVNGVYGTAGVASPSNFPGVRYGHGWVSNGTTAILFGGLGRGETGGTFKACFRFHHTLMTQVLGT